MSKLFTQLLFGRDTSIGIWTYLILSVFCREPLSLWMLLFAIGCAYLPDADFIPFLLLRRRQGVVVGHWVYGHYPLLVIPVEAMVVAVIGYLTVPGSALFLVTLAVTCTLGHFLHDACAKPHGFPLLAPLTKEGRIRFPVPWTHAHPQELYRHYRLGQESLFEEAPAADVQQMYDDCKRWTEGGASEIKNRVEPVTAAQCVIFFIGLVGLFCYWPA